MQECIKHRMIDLLAFIFALLSFTLVSVRGAEAQSVEPLPTAGELGAALNVVPANTPVRLQSGSVPGLQLQAGTLTLVPATTPVPPPGEAVEPPFGDYALQPGGQGKNDPTPPVGTRLITEDELRLTGVVGLTIRIRPPWISVNGKWDWSFPDSCIQRCERTGDRFTILLMSGADDPLAEDKLRFYEIAAAKLGERYGNHPLLAGVHVTGASPREHSEEQFWGKPMPTAAFNANQRMIRAWSDAFPKHVKLYAGSANDPDAMRKMIKYGIEYTKGKFLYKNNAASAKMSLTWDGNQLVVNSGKTGGMMGWEALDDSATTRFGGTLQQAFDKQDVLTTQGGQGKRKTYRAWYPGDLPRLKGIK